MSIKLTEGAIAMLSSGDAKEVDVKPVLQVVDLRVVNTQNQSSGTERYRIMLSDGIYLQQGMLATQQNDLVRSERLQKGSIVQLTQFVCNDIQNRRVVLHHSLPLFINDANVVHQGLLAVGYII
ncbi:hypothetical protein RJ639_013161 [Escallonia herrerae]|uniref:Replication factor-A protein 1 N-terminal domain-containing protein n=1 Tax=Escallonia herrerae TaxID=1293975 RepID=A0AA88VJT6_9ASTE|nr:hypothetical protein RJ639_013161 [Escallonia herrerae]